MLNYSRSTHLHKFTRVLSITFISLASFFAFIPLTHAGVLVTNPARQLEVTVIKGQQLGFILGQPAKDFSIMVANETGVTPIAFQFDDTNIKGLTFVPGGNVPAKGTEGLIDPDDELVFMYKDMGIKASKESFEHIEGQLISELEITEDGISRYAYLLKGNSQRSSKIYANYNFETGYLETETYSLQFDPDNIMVWSDWNIKGFEGTGSAPNILDTMKIRIFAKLGFLKASLHNGIVPVQMLAAKNGPIRAVVESDVSLGLFGVDILTGGLSVTFSAQTIEYPIFAIIPKAANVLSSLDIDVTLDYIDFEGSRYRTALGPKEPLITGQKVSDKVRSQYKSDLDNPWIAISTGKKWDMFFMFNTIKGFRPGLQALYRDSGAGDKTNKPERFKGSSAELGVKLSDIPVGVDTKLSYNLYFGPDLWQGNNPEKAAFDILNPAIVIVKENLIAIN
ncbi:MAG: hypothetical protein COB04_08155 [Gammaproteobacteria bacterium]|nr:MAG: hypothetical protein COB04_08155 [Gammaproteobacteria bacterium]